jgi:hypothetical protein
MLSTTYSAFVPSNVSAFALLGNFTSPIPPFVPFNEINELLQPLDEKYNLSHQYVTQVNSPSILNHNLRMICYSFGLLLSGFPSKPSFGSTQIPTEVLTERIYLSSMLHDLGVSKDPVTLEHPAHTMTFELFGGFLAYDHLHAIKYPSVDNAFIGDVVQSTLLHTSIFDTGNSSAAAMLLHLSAFLDILGWEAFGPDVFPRFWNNQTIAQIEEAFPRLELSDEFADDVEEMLKDKPDCILSHYVGCFLWLSIVLYPDESIRIRMWRPLEHSRHWRINTLYDHRW